MLKVACVIIALLLYLQLKAQKTEFSVAAGSGLFSFTGKSAVAGSFLNYDEQTTTSYTNNPYGSKSAMGFSFGGSIKHVSKKHFLLGADFGYELMRSKAAINEVGIYNGVSANQYKATGNTFLNLYFLNFQPFVGFRFSIKSVTLDVTGGADIAYCLSAEEKGKATTSDGTGYSSSINRKTINTDLRPAVKLAAAYNKFGVYAGYGSGLRNYKADYVGPSNEVYSRLMRFGIFYTL